jgi:hypothetical protein
MGPGADLDAVAKKTPLPLPGFDTSPSASKPLTDFTD